MFSTPPEIIQFVVYDSLRKAVLVKHFGLSFGYLSQAEFDGAKEYALDNAYKEGKTSYNVSQGFKVTNYYHPQTLRSDTHP